MASASTSELPELQATFRRFFEAWPGNRAELLRGLFVEYLDFKYLDVEISLEEPGQTPGVALPASARLIAELDGVNVFYVALPKSQQARVRKGDVVAVAKFLHNVRNYGEMLLLFCNPREDQLHFIHPDFGKGSTPTLRRLIVEEELLGRTPLEQIYKIWTLYEEKQDILRALDEAFDVEPVTTRFSRCTRTSSRRLKRRLADLLTMSRVSSLCRLCLTA